MEVQSGTHDDRKVVNAISGETMANGNCDVHAVDSKSAGGLISCCPGGLPALAGTRQDRRLAACVPRMPIFISAALDRTEATIVPVRRSR
jgi:hypothetical protein